MRLSGKVAVVTGSAVGLGRAVANRYAREGATVVVADTNAPGGTAVVEQIRKDGGKAIFVRTDVGEERDVTTLLQSAVGSVWTNRCALQQCGCALPRPRCAGP